MLNICKYETSLSSENECTEDLESAFNLMTNYSLLCTRLSIMSR